MYTYTVYTRIYRSEEHVHASFLHIQFTTHDFISRLGGCTRTWTANVWCTSHAYTHKHVSHEYIITSLHKCYSYAHFRVDIDVHSLHNLCTYKNVSHDACVCHPCVHIHIYAYIQMHAYVYSSLNMLCVSFSLTHSLTLSLSLPHTLFLSLAPSPSPFSFSVYSSFSPFPR